MPFQIFYGTGKPGDTLVFQKKIRYCSWIARVFMKNYFDEANRFQPYTELIYSQNILQKQKQVVTLIPSFQTHNYGRERESNQQ